MTFSNALERLVAAMALLLCLTPPGHAYEANIGDRAQDFSGFDIVSRKTVHLEDYLGRWVLIDFWATWCGPCMRELPNLIAQTAPYRQRGELVLLSVSCDSPESLPDLKDTIRSQRLDYPVLYDGGELKTIPAAEWGIRGIPNAILVEPQGVIVARQVRGESLGAMLDFYLHHPQPVLGLRGWHRVNEDGTISVFAEVMNPARTPLDVSLQFNWDSWTADASAPSGIHIDRHRERDYAVAPVSFGPFSEAVHEFVLRPTEAMTIVGYSLSIAAPDSTDLGGVPGAGVRHRFDRSQAVFDGLAFSDGKFSLPPRSGWREMSEL